MFKRRGWTPHKITNKFKFDELIFYTHTSPLNGTEKGNAGALSKAPPPLVLECDQLKEAINKGNLDSCCPGPFHFFATKKTDFSHNSPPHIYTILALTP